ncbi:MULTISPECIES: DUF2970 domain-containing protein [Shewanella]|uniref:DUF2970 domain-containing protein n=1 Tax=Shewanella TaxID=22 RepID=UPI0015FFFA4D|nr:DUF2970 domain-containing protein [Shewanella sp. SR43-8]MBB1322383.1 DUF2970 domain-containing protein [Shewanella sp. SR43-8]|tara:strand:+ start:3695 stop:3874 length:180 start_codon:yes stop_codon:yes gene_type:complete
MSIWRVFSSTVAAFFGVQTEQNRQKDFQTQSPLPFIIMGIILAITLVISIILIVNQVLT